MKTVIPHGWLHDWIYSSFLGIPYVFLVACENENRGRVNTESREEVNIESSDSTWMVALLDIF